MFGQQILDISLLMNVHDILNLFIFPKKEQIRFSCILPYS